LVARPRLSATILQLRGSFKAHPERTREDLKGAGPWDPSPPNNLTGKEIAAWKDIVAALPQVALSATERLGLEQMARIRAELKDTKPSSADFVKLDSAFRQWCVQMGMTLAARAKMGTSARKPAESKFQGFKGHTS
jgi:hypothetical protein